MAAIPLLAALAAGSVLLASGGGTAHGSSTARIDALFDDARGLVGGQQVKIAGALAGSIQGLALEQVRVQGRTEYKARIEMNVDARFVPFRANAQCTIRPQGLIGENYVQCDPGHPPAPPLRPANGHPPTVPLANTSEPVNLLDLFNIWNQPTAQRLSIVLAELGIGVSARGQDINELIGRLDPALGYARHILAGLGRQRAQLGQAVESTDSVLAALSGRKAQIQRFIDHAAAVSGVTAAHSDSLSQTIARLPGLLRAATPALTQLDALAQRGTPVLARLRASAPGLNRLADDLRPFAAAAKPALGQLGGALSVGIRASRAIEPLAAAMRTYAHSSLANSKLMGRLFTNLQQRGFIESFVGLFYYLAAAMSRYDSVSHVLGTFFFTNQCSPHADAPVAGCVTNYSGPGSRRADGAAGSGQILPETVDSTLQNLLGYLLK